MKINPEQFERISFEVSAVQVTSENMAAIAQWCKGEIRQGVTSRDELETNPYIKVKVHRPINERQTKAFPGDWVLETTTGFKVYPDKSFTTCFRKVEPVAVAS